MRKKAASALGLLGFAIMAAIGMLSATDFATAVSRAVIAAAIMTVVGFVAGTIAEKAIEEAVDTREPLRNTPDLDELSKAVSATKEEDK